MGGYSLWSICSAFTIIAPLIITLPCFHAGKILVVPVDGSHWVNMNILIKELHSRGHQISVVQAESCLYIKEKSPHYTSITIPSTKAMDTDVFQQFLHSVLKLKRESTFSLDHFTFFWKTMSIFSNFHKEVCEMVTLMFENQELMQTLKDTQYDLVLADPAIGTGALLAHYLQLPLVFNVRWTIYGEGHFDIAPSPVSYIPYPGSELTEKMNLFQRVRNMIHYGFSSLQRMLFVDPHYKSLCERFFGSGVDIYTLTQSADLWLMRVDFVFEFPRPTMPNVIYMGGFQCQPARPLPQDLEDFMQSSGEHGVIVMSLGTIINNLPSDVTAEIASAFAQLPQKVIWRLQGERPVNLGNNTLLVNWMPQNDLLGHPKTRVFVAHGGTNGVYEALYHAVPMVGLPLLFDQPDNLLRMKEKGAAKVLDIASLNSSTFLQALQEVLHEPSYRRNMGRLSSLHLDQPMKPLDSALFWIEFVMRHKGAAHLRTESYRMPWYSYHSVDVVVVLLAIVFLVVFTTVAVFRFLCCRVCYRRKLKTN
ncbi:UD2A2 glucuronosyltransferase, partial [Amia calva]|nr:UD2A2 glucuronosyltransferase [Amia calva]